MQNLRKIDRTLAHLFAWFACYCCALPSLAQTHNQAHGHFATLDWTVAETLLAVGDVQSYQRWVGEPSLPADTLDLGVRLQPNPEQIWHLQKLLKNRPHFINTRFYAAVAPLLEKNAQVDWVDFYREGDAWQNVTNATQEVAALINQPERATQLLQQYQQQIAELRAQAAPFQHRPLLLVQFIDTRHLRIYAPNSLLGAVLQQLGLRNGWQGSHNIWGFETIEVTKLAKLPADSRLVVIKPYPANIQTALAHNTLWQHLELAKDPLILPAVWTFGGIPSAQRFANELVKALQNGGEQW